MTVSDAADRLAGRLCRDAVWSRGRCTWLSERIAGDDRVSTAPVGPDFYYGTAGIALFLHSMADATGDSLFRETAEGALAHALDQAERIDPERRPGFYCGWAGIVWVLSRFDRGEDALRWARHLNPTPELDLLTGSAGAVPALLRVGLTDLAAQHGDNLIAESTQGAWPTPRNPRRRCLTGFAHGAAGIAWSLAELYAATGEDRFRNAAKEGFRYESSCYNPERRNWPDYRNDPPGYMIAWCHGATGIGLSRRRAAEILPDEGYRAEAEIALEVAKSSLENLSSGNFSLCHGHAGNAEFCNSKETMEGGIAEFEERRMPWPCGTKGAGEIPGLMLGIAGIGYSCLRLTNPNRYPSVLCVAGAPTG
jgi:class II lanthipeptide synthase